jgi:hypothetical protein
MPGCLKKYNAIGNHEIPLMIDFLLILLGEESGS